ncbi:class I SAM-dependent methyltransferase [Svornostia abyssi]|uniref:Class I SAM-dependent methyltransferase n=1 Tax=Svornostia abyssi TaxID=2898438 RepID=A0ABY5PLV0_9ACTN|nr:class I SAM-dependent methyltransferase [Parviterribacteraceae bacterium J379]
MSETPSTSGEVIAEYFLDAVEAFEDLVFAQRETPPEHYDEEYFADGWRDGGNRYELETRRRIEARNPQLIQEVFSPQRVLDVGCGPGFLMLFLQELGIDVHGVDYAQASVMLAPPQVRDRITIGETSAVDAPARSFDLVICREVMEHLTVLQVRETVRQLCEASSRFVYVTTRFHPDPATLLDVTTQFDVDPTHITLMSKDLLRVLFVLEGFRRRADLEAQMDWAGKRRVLVYERA